MKRIQRFTALLLVSVLCLSTLSGCGKKEPEAPSSDPVGGEVSSAVSVGEPAGEKDPAVLSAEKPVAKAGGVTVDLGEWFVLEEDAELRVTPGETESSEEEGWQMETYDISVGDLHQLDDFIEIRLPYDSSYFETGQDPAKCLGAKYYDEEAGSWMDILFTVDTAAKELVIYTDHFSRFGAFYVQNAGKRSAYISDVSLYFAMDALGNMGDLTEYCADKESLAKKAFDLGVKMMDAEVSSRDDYAYGLDLFTGGSGNSYLSGAVADGGKSALTKLGYYAIAYNIVKMAAQTIANGQADKETALSTLHTVTMTVITEGLDYMTQAGSAAMAVYMAGAYAAGKMLTTMAQGAADSKMEVMEMVYWHYMESYTGRGHKPMTAKDWRSIIIKLVEKHPDDLEMVWAGIDSKINQVSESFFRIADDELAEVVTDLDGITITHFPQWTQAEKDKMVANYSAHLKNEVLPAVLASVQNYQVQKAEQAMLRELEAAKAFYNTKITVTVKEDAAGSVPMYADHTVRFAPLNEAAAKNAKSWTGKLKADGTYQTTVTLLGFMMAGEPHEIQVFKPGDDPNTAAPVTTAAFTIDIPSIQVTLSSGMTLEDLLGKYTGSVDLKAVKISNQLYAYLQSEDSGDDYSEFSQTECDEYLNEEMVSGWPSVQIRSILLASDDPASGKCRLAVVFVSDEEYTIQGNGVYQDGTISFEENGGSLKGSLTAEKAADGKITLKGSAVLVCDSSEMEDVPPGMDALYMTFDMDCTKS